MDVVVLIRHPAAFAASLKRLGWKHSFATFIQDGRVPEVLRPYEAEIREQAERPGEILAQAALLWRLLYNAVDGYRERHPDWAFVRHEDASLGPGRDLRAALRAARSRAYGGGARGDRPLERARQPGRAGDAARGRARQRGQPRALARRPDCRGGRDAARADARRLAALLLGRGLVAEALERVGGALVSAACSSGSASRQRPSVGGACTSSAAIRSASPSSPKKRSTSATRAAGSAQRSSNRMRR